MTDCQAGCDRPAAICDECRRACALKFFSGISRHPESIGPGDVVCQLCEDGPASWCPDDWTAAVVAYRASLRTVTGRHIGRWPDYPELRA